MTFSIYSSQGKGITYLDEYIETIENHLPVLKETWENLDPYTLNGSWRSDLDRNLELIGTGHYTLLKSLNYVRKNKDLVRMNDPEQRFKNIYFHFGLIVDCIRQISRSILLFKNKLGLINYSDERLSLDEFAVKILNWFKDNYDTDFTKLTNFGISISIPLQPKTEYLSLLATKQELKRYNNFKNKILPYRNIHIHNPTIDIFRRSDVVGDHVVKKEKLKNFRYLSEINQINKNELTNPITMTNQDYLECLQVIREIWTIVLKNLKEINTHPDFGQKSKKTVHNSGYV
jgi:hypothetical protein